MSECNTALYNCNLDFYTYFSVLFDPDDSTKLANACIEKHWFYKIAKTLLGEGLVAADRKTCFSFNFERLYFLLIV